MAERMNPTMHIRMIMTVIVADRIDDRLRPLGRCSVIEVGQPAAMDFLVEYRKVLPYLFYIEMQG